MRTEDLFTPPVVASAAIVVSCVAALASRAVARRRDRRDQERIRQAIEKRAIKGGGR